MTLDLGPQDCTSQTLDAIKVHSVSYTQIVLVQIGPAFG